MSWGWDAKHGIIYRVPAVCRSLYKMISQSQAHGALPWPFSISTLRTREAQCSDRVTQKICVRGVGTQSPVFSFTMRILSYSVQRNHSLKARGQSQPVVRVQSLPVFIDCGILSSIYTTLSNHQLISLGERVGPWCYCSIPMGLASYPASFLSSTE